MIPNEAVSSVVLLRGARYNSACAMDRNKSLIGISVVLKVTSAFKSYQCHLPDLRDESR